MRQATHNGFREEGVRDIGAQQAALIESAPTEPEAFPRRGERLEPEDGKFELARGRVTCHSVHATRAHSRVARSIVAELGRLLDPDRFDIGIADFAVRTPFGVRSPAVVVDVASRRRELPTSAPIFSIAAVLSPSTAGVDFTETLEEYTAIDTLQSYLITSQDEPRAWVWTRKGDGSWPQLPEEPAGRDGSIALGGPGITLTMAAIFRGIPQAPTDE